MALVPLDEARRHVLDRIGPLEVRTLPLELARGLVLAADVVATGPVPPFDNTAMDGFAVRAADTAGASPTTPVRLRLVADLRAGAPPATGVRTGEAARIMTGAPLPAGADAVVPVERTSAADPATVEVREAVEPGRHVRRAGEDVRAGEVVARAGDELTPARLGLLAGVGVDRVAVRPRPRVGVVSTGDELVPAGAPLGPGRIHDANRPMLAALVAGGGFEPVDLGHVGDDAAEIEAVIVEGARRCDAVVSSGGVSMGDADLVKVVLERLGEFRWMQVAIRPAKPLAFGLVGQARVPVFGLPGNPVSVVVAFELFARPALRAMMGHRHLDRPRVRAVADEALSRRPDGKTHFVRVACRLGDDGRVHVRASGPQGSHQLSALAAADGLAVLPDGDGVHRGDDVEVLLLGAVL